MKNNFCQTSLEQLETTKFKILKHVIRSLKVISLKVKTSLKGIRKLKVISLTLRLITLNSDLRQCIQMVASWSGTQTGDGSAAIDLRPSVYIPTTLMSSTFNSK